MERTKKPIVDGVRWKKTPGAPLELYDGRIIEPGEVFNSRLDNIPEAFIDLVTCLEPDKLAEQVVAENALPDINPYILQATDKPHWWNIINPEDGKVINEKPLRKKEAEILLISLNE